MRALQPCPECGGTEFYTAIVTAKGPYGPNLLPGIGPAEFDLCVCGRCGYARFFVRDRLLPTVCEKFTRHRVGERGE